MNNFSIKEAEKYLNSMRFKGKISFFDSIDSTNTYLKKLSPKTDNQVVIASRQTAGRGRQGKTFFSPLGGLYMSVLFNAKDIKHSDLATTLTALAVSKAIDSKANLNSQIKWVNDVYINGKKVCGILTEGLFENGKLKHIIIGIGINIHKSEFPDDIKNIATSIYNETKKEISISVLAAEILNQLEKILASDKTETFIHEIKKRSLVLGENIIVIKTNETYPATAIDINEKGNLIISRNGATETLISGEVSISKQKIKA